MSPDEAIREQREKARHDHATLLYAAIQEGEARGRAEIARNMKRLGLPVDQIAKYTGLSAGEIAKL
jgi:predicted transposase/invertase (TIGR01784 family)